MIYILIGVAARELGSARLFLNRFSKERSDLSENASHWNGLHQARKKDDVYYFGKQFAKIQWKDNNKQTCRNKLS